MIGGKGHGGDAAPSCARQDHSPGASHKCWHRCERHGGAPRPHGGRSRPTDPPRASGGDTLEATTFDAAGRALRSWSTEGSTERVTETTYNALDEPVTEYRYSQPTGGGTKTGETWARANRDPAGNVTDRCTWAAAPPEWCHNAGDTTWATPAPTTRASAAFDARNQRINGIIQEFLIQSPLDKLRQVFFVAVVPGLDEWLSEEMQLAGG